MKDKEIFTELSPEEVKELFSMDMETEKHSIWKLWDDYQSPRIGLHLYKSKQGLCGYYENGRRDKYGKLKDNKTWVNLKITPHEQGSIVSCSVSYNPYLLIIFFFWLFCFFEVIITQDWENLSGHIFAIILMFVMINKVFNEEDLIFQEIRKRLGIIEDKTK